MNKPDREDRLQKVIIGPDISITVAISALDRAGTGVLLLCGDDRKLIGTITDGDIRRAILRGVSLENLCIVIANQNPVTAKPQLTPAEAIHIMDNSRNFTVNHLPVVDEGGRLIDLIMRQDLTIENEFLGISAVVMAGGFGTRLHPLTKELPKPMLPIGNRPLMQLIIEQLREAGIHRVNITTHYQPEKIAGHFGDGSAFGVEIDYVNEDLPLGTAGALGLLKEPDEPLLVINGDILTKVDYRSMLAYHREHVADLTVAVRQYHLQIPYGVLECDGPKIKRIREKPELNFLVNAGIYLLEPTVYPYIENGQRLDMTELIERLIPDDRVVVSFPVIEYWLDIGQHADYEQAQKDVKDGGLLS